MQARPSVMWLLVLHKTELPHSNKMDAKYAICMVKAATEVALCEGAGCSGWKINDTMDSHRMYIKCKTFAGCYSAHRMGRKHTRLIGDICPGQSISNHFGWCFLSGSHTTIAKWLHKLGVLNIYNEHFRQHRRKQKLFFFCFPPFIGVQL